jgi:hypothetical protein
MKTKIVKENSTFLDKAFRDDIECISKLTTEKMGKLCSFIEAFQAFDELNEETNWALFSKEIQEPLDDVLKYARPLQFVAMRAVEEKETVDDIIADLAGLGIIPLDIADDFRKLTSPIVSLVSEAAAKTTPNLPLLRIRSISTHCGIISEFDEEFSVKTDSPDEYAPEVSRLYPVTTLRLSFYNDEQHPVGIQLARKDLLTVIKWLQLAQVQMDSLAHCIKERNLPIVEQGDE